MLIQEIDLSGFTKVEDVERAIEEFEIASMSKELQDIFFDAELKAYNAYSWIKSVILYPSASDKKERQKVRNTYNYWFFKKYEAILKDHESISRARMMLNIPDDKYILELDNINKYSMSITSLYESLSNNTQVKKDHERIRVLLAYYFSLPPEEVSFSKFKKILDSTKLPRIIQNLGNEKSFTHARDKYLPVCHLILADAACDLKNSFIKYVTDNLTVASYFRKKLLAMSSKHATPKHLFLPEGFISIPKEFDLYVSEISEDLKKHWDMCGKKLFNPL